MRLVVLPLLLSTALAAVVHDRQTLSGSTLCSQIASNITGQVYSSPLSENFISDTEHYMTSSSQTPLCVVEPVTPQDVSNIIKLVGQTRTPFAIKSGGHASNPGFSSTPGVFISLVKLNQITLSSDKSAVEIGLGNVS
jgi:FAD/FMN-containing dehydrogenase